MNLPTKIKPPFKWILPVVFLAAAPFMACGRNPTAERGYTFYRSPQRQCGVEIVYPDVWELKDNSDGGDGSLWLFPPDDYTEMAGNQKWIFLLCLRVTSEDIRRVLEYDMYRDIREAKSPGVELVDNRTVVINGHEGLWTEIVVQPVNYPSPVTEYTPEVLMRSIHINVMLEDRLYRITFGAPEEQADGEFRQEFEKIVESIKFVP